MKAAHLHSILFRTTIFVSARFLIIEMYTGFTPRNGVRTYYLNGFIVGPIEVYMRKVVSRRRVSARFISNQSHSHVSSLFFETFILLISFQPHEIVQFSEFAVDLAWFINNRTMFQVYLFSTRKQWFADKSIAIIMLRNNKINWSCPMLTINGSITKLLACIQIRCFHSLNLLQLNTE